MIGFDSSLLVNYYQAKLTRLGGASSGAAGGAPTRYAPTAPWSPQAKPTDASALLKTALQGGKLIDERAATLDLAGASSDYRKLFALYQGIGALIALAERANTKNLSSFESSRILSAFTKGMAEVSNYVDTARLDNARLGFAEVSDTARATIGIARGKNEYVTAPLVTGVADTALPAFQGDVRFNIGIQKISSSHTIQIDLAEMGGQTRTLPNVINHINTKLEAAGVTTRFGQERVPGAERSFQSGGRTIKLAASPDQWAMKIRTDITERVSFQAVDTAPAVYLTQTVGDPDPDGRPATNDGVQVNQLLKFQTETGVVAAPPQPAGEANWVEGRVFAKPLEGKIETVRATQVGPDGSVYILADVTGESGGQSIKGDRDVALMKYDSAGKLIYSRVLGAAENARGLALAVSADGRVAVAGAVTGGLNGAVDGPLNSGTSAALAENSDSFVTVFNDRGEELWTARRGARLADEASQIAFGADGNVYVAGRSRSTMPGATVLGGWDSYIQGFGVNARGEPQSLFTQSFGTASDDRPAGLVVDGSALVTAGIEDGRAIVRRFDISGGAPVQIAQRDLGGLQGGTITGLALDGGQVVIAGSTRNAALDAGNVTRAHAGGVDAFAAQISSSLVAGPGDAVAYYGGTGDDEAAGMAVSNGQVWITGKAGGALPNLAAMGKADGFLARLNVAAGAIDWARQFTGKDGHATPGSIAVAQQGASVLDRLGLPTGELTFAGSAKLTAVSALRAGDQFNITANGGRPRAITIAVNETLESLMLKIRRATGFQVKVDTAVTEGVRRLQIKPLNDRSVIELSPAAQGQDALSILGLKEGVIRASKLEDGKTVAADGQANFYGLGLHSRINLSTPEQIRHAVSELTQAQGVIRRIYSDLRDAATPRSVLAQRDAANNGPAPAYMTNRIANYQAALNRLTGGG